jgi:uncharacterized damage-inducible protein DinB
MTRGALIANRVREVLLNGHWIANTNYKEQLLHVNLEQAIQKVGNLNTIAALAFHINYYLEGLLHVLNGGRLEINDQYSFDVEDLPIEADWNNLVNKFLSNAEAFCNQVEQLSDSNLDQVFVEEKYGTYLRNIEGVIEHSYYHLGQIVLIKKLIMQQRSRTINS